MIQKEKRRNRKLVEKNEIATDSKRYIGEILQAFQEIGLTIILEKCDFGKIEVKILEYINKSEIHVPDLEEVEAMK